MEAARAPSARRPASPRRADAVGPAGRDDARVTITEPRRRGHPRPPGRRARRPTRRSSAIPIAVEGTTIGWVEGPRPSGAVAAVLSYAAAREADKRALAREALDRYRELNLIYDLADQIGATLDVDAVSAVAVDEAEQAAERRRRASSSCATDRTAPRLDGGLLGAVFAGEAEIVNDVAADPRSTRRGPRHGLGRGRAAARPRGAARRHRHALGDAGRVPRLRPQGPDRHRLAGRPDRCSRPRPTRPPCAET